MKKEENTDICQVVENTTVIFIQLLENMDERILHTKLYLKLNPKIVKN